MGVRRFDDTGYTLSHYSPSGSLMTRHHIEHQSLGGLQDVGPKVNDLRGGFTPGTIVAAGLFQSIATGPYGMLLEFGP